MEKHLSCIMDIGEQMLLSGAEIHRAEESVQRMCKAYGAVRADVFIITSSMVVTVTDGAGKTYTQTRRILSTSTNYEALHKLNDLCRKICDHKLSDEQIREDLATACRVKVYPLWLELVSCSMIAGAFTLFFGGSLTEMLVSLAVGLIVRAIVCLSDKIIPNRIFSKFISTAIATALALCAVSLGWISNIDKIVIGNIMSLIPGIGLTNALRDLFTGDSIAGLFRSIEAALAALAIAAGYFLVSVLEGLL